MKVKTSDLIGRPLDWAVAKCEGCEVDHDFTLAGIFMPGWFIQMDSNYWKPFEAHTPSTNWAQGGPIIEREFIEIRNQTSFSGGWEAWKWLEEAQNYLIIGKQGSYCNSPLIAAMRCYVASKLGDEVEVPEELLRRL